MSRTLPTYCEHGVVTDWGDFGPEGDSRPSPCTRCPRRVLTILVQIDQQPDTSYWWRIYEAGEEYASGGPCATATEATDTAAHYVRSFYP